MKTSKKVLIAVLVVTSVFGYSQYVFASQIGVAVTDSKLLEENDNYSTYNLQLEFNNPSLLVLNAGKTEYTISIEDEKIGDGVLEPFVLPAMSKAVVDGVFQSEKKYEKDEPSVVKISGVTKYDVFFTSIDVPFVYFPTEEQSRAFIQQN